MDGSLIQHKKLTKSGRWTDMSLAEQMANIGSEVFRAGRWKDKGNSLHMSVATDRFLELLDYTIWDREQKQQTTKELLILSELLLDYFYGDNQYDSSSESLNKYFEPFSMKAARQRLE